MKKVIVALPIIDCSDWLVRSYTASIIIHISRSCIPFTRSPIVAAVSFDERSLSIQLLETAACWSPSLDSSTRPPQRSQVAINMLARAARPKLALAVPTGPVASVTVNSPILRTPISPSPISPTVRNTRLNQRGASTLQVPSFAYAQNPNTKSILKKTQPPVTVVGKKLQFSEEPVVRCITPVPDDYHGTYVKMSKDEQRWGKARTS